MSERSLKYIFVVSLPSFSDTLQINKKLHLTTVPSQNRTVVRWRFSTHSKFRLGFKHRILEVKLRFSSQLSSPMQSITTLLSWKNMIVATIILCS